MTSPRPYVAAAAAAVLAALFFVPSASASPDNAATSAGTATTAHANTAAHTSTTTSTSTQHIGLADTGSIDTKPYVIGGAGFLVAGAGLIVNAGRRTRRTAGLGF